MVVALAWARVVCFTEACSVGWVECPGLGVVPEPAGFSVGGLL